MLRRLYIDNYRCLSRLSLTLEPVNLLLGPNGSGKSTLLDVLFHVAHLVAQGYSVAKAFPPSSVGRDSASPRQEVELEAELRAGRFLYRLVVEQGRGGREPRIIEEQVHHEGQRLLHYDGAQVVLRPRAGSAELKVPFVASSSPLASGMVPVDSPLAEFRTYLGQLWLVRPVPSAMRPLESESPWLEPDLSNFAGWYRSVVLEAPKIASRIQRSLREVLDGFDALTFPQEGPRKGLLTATFKKARRGAAGPAQFALDELSDGQKVLMGLYAVLHSVVGTGRTLLVDEPENYLALPEIQPWLDLLEATARQHKGQVLLISHHPEVINIFGSSYGSWFERKGAGPVQVQRITAEATEQSGLSLAELVARGWLHE